MTGQAAGLFSFIEYQVLKLGAVSFGFLLWLPQASKLHSEVDNVFQMHLLLPRGTRVQSVTAHYCNQKASAHPGKQGWGASAGAGTQLWFQRRAGLIG